VLAILTPIYEAEIQGFAHAVLFQLQRSSVE
jgi:hypothetical protein